MTLQQRPTHGDYGNGAIEADLVHTLLEPEQVAGKVDPDSAGLNEFGGHAWKEPRDYLFPPDEQRMEMSALWDCLTILDILR